MGGAWSPRAAATGRSPAGWCSASTRFTGTSRTSTPGSAARRGPRRWPRPRASACSDCRAHADPPHRLIAEFSATVPGARAMADPGHGPGRGNLARAGEAAGQTRAADSGETPVTHTEVRPVMEPLAEYKNIARGLWAAGDYDLMARTEGLYATGDHLVRAAGISSADRVLDVACGTGNATLPAAATGAMVTGLDLTPAMLATAAKRAAD